MSLIRDVGLLDVQKSSAHDYGLLLAKITSTLDLDAGIPLILRDQLLSEEKSTVTGLKKGFTAISVRRLLEAPLIDQRSLPLEGLGNLESLIATLSRVWNQNRAGVQQYEITPTRFLYVFQLILVCGGIVTSGHSQSGFSPAVQYSNYFAARTWNLDRMAKEKVLNRILRLALDTTGENL